MLSKQNALNKQAIKFMGNLLKRFAKKAKMLPKGKRGFLHSLYCKDWENIHYQVELQIFDDKKERELIAYAFLPRNGELDMHARPYDLKLEKTIKTK